MNESVLGLVPARTGSKRVENKNLRTVGEKSLLARAVEQACAAENLNTVICSSDDNRMREVALEHGATVPFERPESLATDDATNDQVTLHALEWFSERDEQFDIIAVVPPTAPFRLPDDIDGILTKLRDADAKSAISVVKSDSPPQWAMSLDGGDWLEPALDNGPWGETQTQHYQTLYQPNGAVFAARVSAFREAKSFYTNSTVGYVMPRERSIDIDEPFDLEVARALLEWRGQ